MILREWPQIRLLVDVFSLLMFLCLRDVLKGEGHCILGASAYLEQRGKWSSGLG